MQTYVLKKQNPLELVLYSHAKGNLLHNQFVSTKCHLLHNFISFCSSNTSFLIHEMKFKYQPGHLDGNESKNLNKLIVTHATVEECKKLSHQPCVLIPDLLETVKNGQIPR